MKMREGFISAGDEFYPRGVPKKSCVLVTGENSLVTSSMISWGATQLPPVLPGCEGRRPPWGR
jgi:hypothetical protein